MHRLEKLCVWSGLALLILSGCSEDDALDIADFEGFWLFDVVVLPDSCAGDVSGQDCLRIQQSGRELLIVDDQSGNYVGTVEGNTATLTRDTARRSDQIVIELGGDGQSASGSGSEEDFDRNCITRIEFRGTRQPGGCPP